MCGIVGFTSSNNSGDQQRQILQMMDAIKHRGPDDEGFWQNGQQNVILGFRRLAILDLSPSGHQPMHSGDNNYSIVYNGEVYNFQEIRSNLIDKGHAFLGSSDTEVILAAFNEWGIPEATKKFNGMFAIAVWDEREKLLYLIRDRIGVKPLYYGWQHGVFFFASDLSAISKHPKFSATINHKALAEYVQYGYVPCPYSIYDDISKLEPATIIGIDPNRPGEIVKKITYWDGLANNPQTDDGYQLSEEELLEKLEALLIDSVRLRMIADVPLGAFLSGGIDSTTIVALMQAQSSRPIKTFTIGFHEDQFNEAQHAKRIAQYLGTDHTELYLNASDAMKVIDVLPQIYNEPFADPSQIPTYLVSKLARQKVTVSLSGDGGDELFLGYNRYEWARKIWAASGWMPKPTKSLVSKLLAGISTSNWDKGMQYASALLPKRLRFHQFGDKMQKFIPLLDKSSPQALYESLITFWSTDVIIANQHETNHNGGLQDLKGPGSFLRWMSHADIRTYLPDDILVKVDRASMAVGLEARVPFIDDHRLVEFATSLPTSLKIRNGESKWALRQVLNKYIPKELVARPKMGFGVPIGDWIRGPLNNWAADLLSENRMKRQGLFHVEPIQQKLQEHQSGKRNWQYHLWSILMFQAWFDDHHSS